MTYLRCKVCSATDALHKCKKKECDIVCCERHIGGDLNILIWDNTWTAVCREHEEK